MIICNSRVLSNNLTGVQRYILEVSARMGKDVELISPSKLKQGIGGHLWEQLILPYRVKNNLLWSPSNTGPMFLENQVLTLHDVNPLDNPQWVSKNFSKLYRFIIPKLVKNVRRIITDSEFSKCRIIHHFPASYSKIDVVPLATDSRFKPTLDNNIQELFSNLDIPVGRYFVALGSIEPRKNLSRLLAAWKKILPILPDDINLILVGALGKKSVFGDYDLGNLSERIFFTGHIDDVYLPSIYSGALGSVYISLYEGFGLPPLEAISCGTPLIFSDIPSIREVVGNAGIPVNPLKVDEIAEAIVLLAKNESIRYKLGIAGLSRAQSFSWDETTKRTLDILSRFS